MTKSAYLIPAAAMGAALTLGLTACGGGAGGGAHRIVPSSPATATPAVLASTTGAGTLTTVGVGTVAGEPDTLTLGISVTTTATHASTALAQNNVIAARVQQVLQADGVAGADLQTTGLSLQQAYPAANGYQVEDQVTATVRNLSKAGTIIDDALAAAGDAGRLDMAYLSMSTTSPYLATARQHAVAAARLDAEQLAAAAGERLGTLVSLTDQAQQPGPVFAAVSGEASASAAPVPVQPGTQQVTVNVTAVWSISPVAG
jgi:uncharacterized protein